jgi:ABC-type multidrug transport system fused ATPase/permease subunit
MTRIRALIQNLVPAEIDATSLAPTVSPREVIRRFWPAVRPYRGRLAVVLVLAMIGPLLDTLSISLYGRLVDEVLVPRQLAMLAPIAAAYVGLTIAGGLLGFGRSYLSAWITEHLLFDLRSGLFAHLQTLPLAFFERSRLGDTVTRVTDDVDELGEFLATGFADGVSHLLKIVFYVGALFYLDARLAVISLVVAPPFWFLGRRFASRVKALAREQRARDGAVTAIVEESLGNAPLVQAYNGQAAAAAGFERETRTVMATQLALERLRAGYAPLVSLIEVGGMLIVIGAGAIGLAEGRLTLGGLLAFLAYLSQLYGPVRGLNHLWGEAVATSAAAERVIELMDRRPSVVEPVHPAPLGRAAGSIVFDRVSYRYPGTELDALRDVSFELSPGETLALVGQSGAGKSTATRLLLRLDDPSAGRVLIDGHDLRDVSITGLRQNVTVLPQEALFFDVTVREAIAYGRPGASDREIVAAARAAGAHHFIERLGQGYDTRIGQRGRGLSGGQRQRLAIARALLRDAPVLVLDEPTTGLDDENATQILGSIRRLMEGKTTIIVSHDLHLVRQATRIVVLERGRVVEAGSHEALISSDGLYARLSLARERDGETAKGTPGDWGHRQDGKSEDWGRAYGSGRGRDGVVASSLSEARAVS